MIPTDAQRAALAFFSPLRQGAGSAAPQDGTPQGATARQAWLRAMEQAQMARWFQPFQAPAGEAGSATAVGAAPAARAPAASPLRAARVEARSGPADQAAHDETAGAAGLPRSPAGAQQPAAGDAAAGAARRSAPHDGAEPAGSPARDAGPDAAAAPQGADAARPRHGPLAASGAARRPGAQVVAAYAQAQTSAAVPVDAGAGAARAAGRSAAEQVATAAGVQALPPDAAAVVRMMVAAALQDVPPASLTFAPDAAPPRPVDAGTQAWQDAQDPAAIPGAAAPRPAAPADRTAVRTHVQWSADGLALWLGLDGTAEQVALQAAAIVGQLGPALQLQGQRLHRVVCNGRVVWDDAAGIRPAATARFASFLDPAAQQQPPSAPFPTAIPSPVFQEIP